MTIIWIFLALLAIPSLCVRFSIMHRNLPLRPSLLASYFTGVCQDLFISFQQFFLLILLKVALPIANGYLFWIFVALSSLLQIHLMFDAFLHRKTAIRMEISFFSLFNDVRCFWDSAKEKKVWRFIPGALIFLIFPLFTYWHCWEGLQQLTLKLEWINFGLILAAIGTLGHFFLPKKLSYATDHIIFQHEMWYVRKLFRFIKRKNDQTDLNYLARARFCSQNEKRHAPSSEYPLFKYTQGFTGEKTFQVDLKEGEQPHVIFLFLESFRSHNVGCLGAERGVTPHFDRLSKEGILFTDFYANSVRTSRSVVSSLFGIPSDVDGSEAAAQAKAPFLGIPQLMQEAGYQTSYLHNGPIEFEKQDVFFDLHGYDVVRGRDVLTKAFPKVHSSSWGLPDECLMHYAADFLEKRQETPQFLTLFSITNHHPWNLPSHYEPPSFPSEISRIYRKYLSTFHYSDACLGLLINLLEEKGLLENTLLFILGDHGYPMGEHNNFVEQRYLYEENIRVPLLIYGKGRIIEPKRITTPCSQLDLVPTLMDILKLHGFNLSIGSTLMRECQKRTIFFHNPYVFKNFGCRTSKYKFIYTRISQELELYDLEKDPGEKENIAPENPELAREFLQSVKDYERLFHDLYADKRIVPEETPVISTSHFSEASLH
ncbi:MAG: sulfatase-like hydrolase/transferase [Chlamydiia bacterium]|nr:sulfatase-like hydrolase/transferase [Chlamydiia bacterium]